MKIKTFLAENPTQLDEMVNTFEDTHQVKATQTDAFVSEGIVVHKAVVFYKVD